MWSRRLCSRKSSNDGMIVWSGPIMASNNLIAFSSDGRVAQINPEDGGLVREWNTGSSVFIAPVIAGQTLYLLSDDGTLAAYR